MGDEGGRKSQRATRATMGDQRRLTMVVDQRRRRGCRVMLQISGGRNQMEGRRKDGGDSRGCSQNVPKHHRDKQGRTLSKMKARSNRCIIGDSIMHYLWVTPINEARQRKAEEPGISRRKTAGSDRRAQRDTKWILDNIRPEYSIGFT